MRRCLLVLALLSAACGGGDSSPSDDGRLRVVASFFPLAELARAVGGPDVDVKDLTPAGVEPHDLELDSLDVDRIQDADVVLYLGGDFQPAVEGAAAKAKGRRVDLLPPGTEDPHVWLDPVLMAGFVDRVVEAFGPASRARGDEYKRALAALDDEYRARLTTCGRRVIVTTHEAFGHLARRYHLVQEPLTGLSPEAEPDPKRLAELADLVRAKGVTTVFTEGTEESKSADALAREAGVKTAVLQTLEFGTGKSYIEGMRANIGILSDALGCR
jgi:zinc transport system substrate-binding protein